MRANTVGNQTPAVDGSLRAERRAAKRANDERLADDIRRHAGADLGPSWLFDIQPDADRLRPPRTESRP
jgi:hypothetical protein